MRSIIHTGLTDSEIDGIIELSDAEIDKRLGTQDASDKVIKKLSILLTASTIKICQPGSISAGEYSESNDKLNEVLVAEIERIYRLYSSTVVSSSRYGFIDEDERNGVAI